MSLHPESPGLTRWVIAIAILLVATVVFVTLVVRAASLGRKDYPVVDLPGQADVTLPMRGRYVIYHEYERQQFERVANTPGLGRPQGVEKMTLRLAPRAGGETIDIRGTDRVEGYTLQRTVATPVYEFDAPEPGEYTILGEYPADYEGVVLRFSLKPLSTHRVLWAYGMGTAVIAAGGVLMLLVLSTGPSAKPTQPEVTA